ncbi:Outer membrane protein beta-barrel domain-containing protein [Hymenobacter daecheongensis DSM 21074]|uniref:Outer membrane protein beta-barrel domain-containing protein n=1 Tax=Hymenobacter daecheongensis DSM 21074 TaxID=1121955 RepID=A0A1M6HKC6_9BACT|nr:outer membrane beta-barrel protein [Hymenobacter daecheongensis]SHJ22638.1 Outer membrane protein beta-barrel domain-containing protein [Hymenobacter daecheongensis DSM 21074]
MKKFPLCSLALLATLPLAARATAPAQPDTTAAPAPRTHALKLGLRTTAGQGLLPTAGYEWQLRPRLSLQTSLGYTGSTWHGGYSYVNDDYTISNYSYTLRARHLTAAAELRYYFQRTKPALLGWYAGVGLGTSYNQFTYAASNHPTTTTSSTLTIRPQLRLGRQWSLGQRLLLDTYLGLDMNQQYFSRSWRNRWQATGVAGFQLGYRF